MDLTDGVITMRYPVESDAAAVAQNVRASLPELQRWMTWATDDYDETDALAWMRDEFEPGSEAFLVVDSAGDPIGSFGLGPLDEKDLVIELGYWIRTDRTGRGAATRGTRLLTRHAVESRGAQRVELYISVENEASRRVAEKAGATHEGIARNRILIQGRHHDAHVYSIIAADLSL